MIIFNKKSLELNAAALKMRGIFLLLIFCFSCSFGEITQYIVIKDGETFHPYAKVTYQISADRREVFYWVDIPTEGQSEIYVLKNPIIKDLQNWEGEAEHILLWKIRVEMVNGKLNSPAEGLANVNWYTWYFLTNPSPGLLSKMLRYGLLLLGAFGIFAAILFLSKAMIKRKRHPAYSLLRHLNRRRWFRHSNFMKYESRHRIR